MAKKSLKKKRREVARAVAFILDHPATPVMLFTAIANELADYGNYAGYTDIKQIEKTLRKMDKREARSAKE